MVASPDHNTPTPDRRGSFRCQVSGARGRGQVRIGEEDIAVEVRDESASGLSIVFDGQYPIAIGEQLLIEIDASWTEVQVMNCRQQEVVVPGEAGEPVQQMRMCLGLKRLRDLETDDFQSSKERWRDRIDVRALLERMLPVGRQFGGVAAVVGGIFLTGLLLVWGLETTFKKDPKRYQQDRPTAEVKVLPLERTVSRYTRPERTVELPKWPFGKVRMPSISKQPLRLPNSDFLFSPEVIDELKLTADQIEVLTRAVQHGRISRAPLPSEAGLEDAPTTVELAAQQLEILSEAQRLALKRLIASSQALPSAAEVGQTLTGESSE